MSGTCMYLTDEERLALIAQGWAQLGGPFDTDQECASSCHSGAGPCCGCSSVPSQYTMIVAGITNGACTFCNNYNGTFTLTLIAGLTPCEWDSQFGTTCANGFPGVVWSLTCDSTYMRLSASGSFAVSPPGSQVVYKLALSSWDCLGSNTLIRDFTSTIECSGWPASLTVNPI